MPEASAERRGRRARPPLWRDVRVLRVLFQVVVLGAVAGIFLYLSRNLSQNLQARGISTGFEWFDQPAGFTILGSDFRPGQSFRSAIMVGVRNTALVAFTGIVLATILGIVVGVGRLSSNWLVRKASAFYVEALRNIPVVVIIIFVYLAVVLQLPRLENAVNPGFMILSVRGLWVPWLDVTGDLGGFWLAVGAGAVAAVAVGVWRTRRFNLTGEPHHRILWGVGILAVAVLAGYFLAGGPLSPSLPEPVGPRVEGGLRLTPEYGALLFALVIYTASHIAEIVRGSILAVPKGQIEAATAVGLTPFHRLRYVILPQAFRIAVPPTGNQYLNLTKNSSLAVFIGFPEITRLISLMIQQVPAHEAVAVLMGIYLAFSLTLSAVTNLVNRALAIKER